jgi:Domain of unknown function (DUF4112)
VVSRIDVDSLLGTLRRLFLPAPRPRWPALSPVARRVEQAVRLLDSAIPIPGTSLRVGIDPILGFVLPAAGDAIGGFVSLGVLFLAVQYRVPAAVLKRMVFNVAIDVAVGSVPIVGDVFDFGWKANDRNFALLMRHRGDQPKHGQLRYWFSVGGLLILGLLVVALPIAILAWLIHQGVSDA